MVDAFVEHAHGYECAAPSVARNALAGRFLLWSTPRAIGSAGARSGWRDLLLSAHWYLLAAIVCVLLLLLRMLRRTKRKPKIN